FFIDSTAQLLEAIGLSPNINTLQIILPVGISFYTFQTLSYTIDVYRKRVDSVLDPIAFFAFVSFFPQLVAGPIERASDLLPQFLKQRHFELERASGGARMMLWGLFKKIVIADNLAPAVDDIFINYADMSGPTLLLGTIFFAVQIYCDFSGYSEIAIGSARLIGFDLTQNFNYPYFSRNVGEFWRRWHITLSSWFRDYVYIPLGGSRTKTKTGHLTNLVITFTLSGFWHGANWTFLAWGLLHGLFYLPLVLADRHHAFRGTRISEGQLVPKNRETIAIIVTFLSVCFAWIFFRATSIFHAFSYIAHLFSPQQWLDSDLTHGLLIFPVIGLFVFEWIQRDREHPLDIENNSYVLRWGTYYLLIAIMLLFRAGSSESFIYFQF
ncbi:MAG: MBOAT family O-acyltransferase, partial [Chloroflexota bacterium]